MNTFEVVQGAIIAVVVAASAFVAFRKLLPKTSARVLARFSARLNRPGGSAVSRFLARRLRPAAATGVCGSGCGSCGTCGSSTPRTDVQPLHFKRRA